MKVYMKDYIKEIDSLLEKKKITNLPDVISNHLIKIKFFQHERLIHLLVTLFYAIFCIIFLSLITLSYIFAPIALILLVFLVFYIFHYFFLENGVQYMYKQYDLLVKKDS